MRKWRSLKVVVILLAVGLAAAMPLSGCGQKETSRGKNLISNGSFEKVSNGLPVGWELRPFRGLDKDLPAEWGVDEERAYDGKRSFYFVGTEDTRRFFTLTQSFNVKGVERLRVRGAIKTLDVVQRSQQFPQANFAITCYDAKGERTESSRFYDLRTPRRVGTSGDWILEDRVFRIPRTTARVEFHCVLGMEGKIWFDAISVEVAQELAWNTSESKNFTFHWLSGSEYPEGSREFQQELFDYYCTRLGIPEEDRPKISSYFYPDSATLFEDVGVKTAKKSYWDEKEVHMIYPVDDHEIIHIITKPYGILPFALTEGTAFYLMQNYKGRPVLQVAQELQKEGKLPGVIAMTDPGTSWKIDPDRLAPAAASFVGYLIEMGGPSKFLELHREANVAHSVAEFDAAFRRVYGVSAQEAEKEWLKLLAKLDFSKQPPPGPAPSDTTGYRPDHATDHTMEEE
jgi:hypothetical protein